MFTQSLCYCELGIICEVLTFTIMRLFFPVIIHENKASQSQVIGE